jgi:hypothetical protein
MVGFGFDKPNYTFSFSVMILILEPPSRSTSSIKFFPTWNYITAIWWSMAIETIVSSNKVGFNGNRVSM